MWKAQSTECYLELLSEFDSTVCHLEESSAETVVQINTEHADGENKWKSEVATLKRQLKSKQEEYDALKK